MSTIDKMLIKGIRSFSPDNKTVIEFYKPLTLIVGANGAGKTTIIECLKHACTGELPPNARSGHTFVHDPKVAGETETKGQIKLRFKTTAGRDVVCIRSFQLTQKASKLEYKAVESVLQTIDPRTGEKVALSYRCADMDREVPSLMGVPKAVLENVIFVHQDEANWPLAEAAVLKKKFDEIFSATRYTKALEVIKKLHKEQAQQVKEYKLKLDHLQTLKDAAYKLNQDIDIDNNKSTTLQSKIKDLEQKVAERQSRIDSIGNALRKMRTWQNEIEVKEGKRVVLHKQSGQLYEALIEESDETTEDLIKFQQTFAQQFATMRVKAMKIDRELIDTRMQDQSEKENFNKLQLMKGKLQAEAETCNNDRQERDRLIQTLAAKHNIPLDGAPPLSDQAASAFYDAARQRLEEVQRNLQQMKAGNKRRDDELTSDWERVRSQFIRADGNISLKMQQKAQNEGRQDDLTRQIQSLAPVERALHDIEDKVRETDKESTRKQDEYNQQNYEGQLLDMERELQAIRQRTSDLQREKDLLNAETADRVQLRMKRQDLVEKEKSYKQIISEQQARLRKLFNGRVPEAHKLHNAVKALASSTKSQFENIKKKADDATQKGAILEERHRAAVNNLSNIQAEFDKTKRFLMTSLRSLLDGDIDVSEYQELKDDQQQELVRSKANLAVTSASEPLFQKYINGAEKDHKCVVCDRPLNSREQREFVAKYQGQRRTLGDEVARVQRKSSNAESTLNAIQKLEPEYFAFDDLRKKLPAAENDLRKIEEELERAREMVGDAIMEQSSAEVEFKEVEKLEGIAATVDRLVQEANVLREKVKDQEFKLETLSQTARSVADVNIELEKLEDERDEKERKRDRIHDKQKREKDEVNAAQHRWRNARDEKFQADNQLRKLQDAEKQKAETSALITNLDTEIQVLQQKLGPLQREQDALLRQRDLHRETAQREEAAEDDKSRVLQRDVDQLRAINAKISKYLLSGSETRLRETLEKITQCSANQKLYEAKIEELRTEVELTNEQVQKYEQIKRNIEDNLNYRAAKEEELRLTAEIDELQQKVVALGDETGMSEDMERGRQDRDTMNDEANRLRGTVSAYEGNIKRNRTELRDPRYADIENRYRNQLIQLKTTEMANKDLDKYYHALDKALMRFHSLKMEEINKIIKELWQQTYRGQDIDYIEIRSDAETTSSARSYAYRVVMRSGDAELDMRGRCSAGQKVLASLIIRLALAETFCLNCGILALDEPTTNLDTPNAESLAAALSRIMQDRKTQQNFQLIVITHDERFAQLIGHREYAEKYYRISKNEHQHSHIEVQDIFD